MKKRLKRWLFAKEIKDLEKIMRSLEQINSANEFFIRQGVKASQYQINNPKAKNMPFTLMGHGIPTAAKHLGCTSLQWERARKKEAEEWMKRMAEKSGIVFRGEGRIFRAQKGAE